MNTPNFRHLHILPGLLLLAAFALLPNASQAQSAPIGTQACASNEECKLVSNSCNDSCGYVPIATANLPALQSAYQARCGKPMDANMTCVMNPPLGAACINGRCTIDYAYANHAGPKDYKKGANKVVKGSAPAPLGANIPPAALPTPASSATPPEVVPATMAPQRPAAPQTLVAPRAQATQPSRQPSGALVPGAQDAGMAYEGTATIPQLRQAPNTEPAPTAPYVAKGKPVEYVPQETVPAPDQTTRRAVATGAQPSNFGPKGSIIPADGTPNAVPQAPAGSVPIPPSDLKPAPTFVPPPGVAIPVSPEDPGAPPPPGTTLMMREDGKLGTTTSTKSFSKGETKTNSVYSGTATNQ